MALGVEEVKAVLITGGDVRVPKGFHPPFRISRSTAGPGAGHRSIVFRFDGSRVKKSIVEHDAEFELVIHDDGMSMLRNGETFIDEVTLEPTLYHSPEQAFFMMDQRCQFNCLFCNSPNLDHEVTKKLTDDRIVSMTVEAEGMKAFALTSGVVGSPHETVVRMAGIVRRVREALPDLPVGVEPYIGEPEDIDLLLDAGANEIKINIETYDRELMGIVCPDLDLDHILRMIEHAVDVFGRGNVTSNIIFGMGETDENVLEGVERLASMGCVANLRALRLDDLNRDRMEAALGPIERVTPERVLKLARAQRAILENHGLTTPLRTMCAECTCCDLVPFKDL